MKNASLTILLSIAGTVVFAQGNSVVNLGPNINTKYEEINPIISPDGTTLYFNRCDSPDNKFGEDSEEIYFSTKEGNSWTRAQPVTALNIAKYNAIFGILEDGKTFLIKNTFNKFGNKYKSRGLSLVTKEGDNWSRPVPLRVKIDDEGMATTGYITPDGNTIFLAYTSSKQGENNDIYVIEKTDGSWGNPKALTDINGETTSEDAPFLSSDGKTLYFSSNRGKGNRYNIYTSERQGETWDKWSAPEELSSEINGRGWESYYKINEAARLQYFCATNKSRGMSDIFTLAQRSTVIIYGKLINVASGSLFNGNRFDPKTNFKLLANGKPVDSLVVNPDGSYAAKVPVENIVTIEVDAPHYKGTPEKLDPRKIFGGKQALDLKLVSDPYIVIRGKLLVQNNGQVVPSYANPRFLIDKVPYDSVKIDPYAGTYELHLPYGKAYMLELEADNFQSLPRRIDLSSVNAFEERKTDMYISQSQVTILQGRLTDPETKRPVPGAKVYVEGVPDAATEVDPVTGNYELRVPSGKSYEIVYSAPQYIKDTRPLNATKSGNMTVIHDIYLNKLKVGTKLDLKRVYFDFSKAHLKPESYPELEKLVSLYKDYPQISAEIAGHTDNVGSSAGNLILSQERCQSVVNYLISRGIPASQLKARGYGLTRPVATNATAAGRAQNRRVEFVVLGM